MLVDQHFGHATQFLICETDPQGFRLVEVRRNEPACGATWAPGSDDPMERSAALVADCQAVLVARIGECGVDRLAERGIEAFELPGPIEAALRRLAPEHLQAATRHRSQPHTPGRGDRP